MASARPPCATAQRVLVVEDVPNTGGSIKRRSPRCAAGGDVVAAAARVNRGAVTAAQVGRPPGGAVRVALDAGTPTRVRSVWRPVNTDVGKGRESARRA
jgi:hypothetical protein